MFHVKHLANLKFHQIIFLVFLFCLPFQTRIIYNKPEALIGQDFSLYLAITVYLTDLLFLTSLFTWILIGKPRIRLSPAWILVLFPGLSLLFHVEPTGLYLFGWIKWVELFSIIWYISQNFRQKALISAFFQILFISGVTQAIIGIFQFHTQHSLNLSWLGEYVSQLGTPGLATIDVFGEKLIRGYGTFPHPNIFGGFLATSLVYGLQLFVSRETRIQRAIISLGLITLYYGIFFSFSRSAWIIAILITTYYLFHIIRSKQVQTLKIFALLLVVSCGTLIIGFRGLLVSRGTTVGNADNYRIDFTQTALSIWQGHFWTGTGFGNYTPVHQSTKPNLPGWLYQPAHNIYVHFGAELGIIGLAITLPFLIRLLGFTWNIRSNQAIAMKIAFISILIIGLFDHYLFTIQQGRLITFTIIGLMAALPYVPQETSPRKPNIRLE